MEKTSCIIILLNIFIQIGCTASNNVPSSKDYMPLSIGNKWTYGSESEYVFEKQKIEFIKEIVNIDTILNRIYFKVKNEYLAKDSNFTFFYYQRISADTLFSLYYDGLSNSYLEFIEAIFSLNIGDTTCIYSPENFSEKCREYIIVTNKTEDDFEILHNNIEASDEEQWYTYKRGFGIVIIRSAWGGTTELLEYEIR
jgi:hypothetical protein